MPYNAPHGVNASNDPAVRDEESDMCLHGFLLRDRCPDCEADKADWLYEQERDRRMDEDVD